MNLIHIIRRDKERFGDRSFFSVWFRYPSFRTIVCYRLTKYFKTIKIFYLFEKLALIILLRYQLKTGIELNPGCEFGPGLYIPHFGPIIVNPKAIIGENCYLSHCVTIGKVSEGIRKGVPHLGNNVRVGVGVVILGGIRIGNGVIIGANSVVLTDVPDNCFVAGSPARIIKQLS